jgi:Lar family restriction alleviation protein
MELKPCPFCGSEVKIKRDGGWREKYYQLCTNNDCVMQDHLYNTEAEAIEAWNRRADAPLLAERVEELEKELKTTNANLLFTTGQENKLAEQNEKMLAFIKKHYCEAKQCARRYPDCKGIFAYKACAGQDLIAEVEEGK